MVGDFMLKGKRAPVLLAAVLFIMALISYAASGDNGLRANTVNAVQTSEAKNNKKAVALTFDDGPGNNDASDKILTHSRNAAVLCHSEPRAGIVG